MPRAQSVVHHRDNRDRHAALRRGTGRRRQEGVSRAAYISIIRISANDPLEALHHESGQSVGAEGGGGHGGVRHQKSNRIKVVIIGLS